MDFYEDIFEEWVDTIHTSSWAILDKKFMNEYRVQVIDRNTGEELQNHIVTLDTIQRGINALYNIDKSWSKVILRNVSRKEFDLSDCDIILQLGIFGKLLYV